MEMSGLAYTCRAGDTWDMVSLRVYGDERFAPELMLANPLLAGVSVFDGGESVAVPVVDAPDQEAENVYLPSNAPWRTRGALET